MFSAGYLAAPIMGAVQDHYAVERLSPALREKVVSQGGLDERKVVAVQENEARAEIEQAKQHSASMTLRWVSAVPAFLTVAFGAVFLVLGRSRSASRRLAA